jgi:hypothetical protein
MTWRLLCIINPFFSNIATQSECRSTPNWDHIVVMVKSPAISLSVYKSCRLPFGSEDPGQSYVRARDETRKQLRPLVLLGFPRDTFHYVNMQYARPGRDRPISRGQGHHAKYKQGGLSNLSPCAAATPLSLIKACERLSRTRCLPADAGSDTTVVGL